MACVMTAAHVTLQTYWQEARGNPARHVQSEIACQDIERRYQIRLPDDFRAYLIEAAPKTDYWDREDVIWWSPDRIKNVLAEYEPK